MAKTKKRQQTKDPFTLVIVGAEEFPAAITVELWHRPPKGKRTLVGTRRYEMGSAEPAASQSDTPAADMPAASADGATPPRPRAAARRRPAARKRPAQA